MILKNAEQIAKRANMTADEFVRGVYIKLFSSVVMDTRYDTGRMKANWQLTQDSPAKGDLDEYDQQGTKTVAKINAGVKGGDRVQYLTNNVPYVGVYEQEDAMVAKNIARIETNIRKIAKDIK